MYREGPGWEEEERDMLGRNDFPVLEFDDNPTAKLNPVHFVEEKFKTDKMVITFFPEVVNSLAAERLRKRGSCLVKIRS